MYQKSTYYIHYIINNLTILQIRNFFSVKRVFIYFFALCLSFPLLNDYLKIVNAKVPYGVSGAKPKIPFSKASFLNKSYQKSFNERSKKESGLWLPGILVSREILRTFFQQISPYFNSSIVLGNQGYLFPPAHLTSSNHLRKIDRKKMTARYKKFLKLQKLLAKRGTQLVLVITPNLVEIYPDLVPDMLIDPTRFERPNPYQAQKEILQELSIDHVDTYEILMQALGSYPFKLFARSAAHWNDVASCISLSAVIDKLIEKGAKNLMKIKCDKWNYEYPPKSKDRDLVRIANVLRPSYFYDQTPYIVPQVIGEEPASKPKVLLVGTSYLFAFAEHLHKWKLVESLRHFFYFKQVRKGGEITFKNLKKGSINWEDILTGKIIILNVGMATPDRVGYGFVEEALKYLGYSINA